MVFLLSLNGKELTKLLNRNPENFFRLIEDPEIKNKNRAIYYAYKSYKAELNLEERLNQTEA